jgi:hypothetical protein
MQSEDSVSYSQEPAIGSYPELVNSKFIMVNGKMIWTNGLEVSYQKNNLLLLRILEVLLSNLDPETTYPDWLSS